MAYDTFKNLSKKYDYKGDQTLENVNCGSLQRIADATEAMAHNYTKLLRDVEQYRSWYEGERKARREAERKAAALKGVITRMKNKGDKEATV